MKNIVKIKREDNWVGVFRIEYDSKYVTLYGRNANYPISDFQGNETGQFEETVLIYEPELIEVRNANPEIIEVNDKEIVIDLKIEYKCSYCKDEGWINDDNGITSSPCPMNCRELSK